MKTIQIITYCLAMLGVSACTVTSLSVITDYDRDARFSEYKTFYWTDDFQMQNGTLDEPLFYNTLIKKRLKTAIESEMKGRGYSIDEKNPDLLVDSRVIVQEKSVSQDNYTSPYYYRYYYGYNSPTISQRKEGGVVIELIDKDRRQLVWQGYAPDVLRTETEDKQKEIREAVSKIFVKYDYRAGSTN